MSGSSVRMYRATLRTNSAPPKLVVVEAECLSPDERTAFALLSSRVAAVLVPCPAQGELAIQCQAHSCSLNQAAVIVTSQRGLSLLLEAGIALALTYGIGLHLGQPVCQNPRGDLLGEVMNVGDIHDKNTRVYETNLYLPYHSDPSDVVGLMCVRKARQGGLSSLVSVAAIYNEILDKHRELLGLYYRPIHFAHLCEPQPSLSPIFSYHQGKLSCRYLRQYIELGADICKLPLSRVEIEALDVFDRVMADPALRLDMMLEPGDLQFANNYAVLHSRTEFEDHEDLALRRKMLRLWLKMPNARQLAPEFPGRNGFPAPEPAAA